MNIQSKLLLCLSFLLAHTLSATSWRVNNVSGNADFDNLSDAHTLAAAGDTLYIEGTGTGYGSLTMTKPLTLIGPGYFPGENPNTTVSQQAEIATISLDRTVSTDPFSGASGSVFMGLSFISFNSSGISTDVSNVTVKKNRFRGDVFIEDDDISNILVSQNYFETVPIDFFSSNGGINGITFTNNIVLGPFELPMNTSGAIEHNLFDTDEFDVQNFAGPVKSNIFASIGTTDFTLVVSSNLVTHNTGGNNQFGTANSNTTIPPGDMHVGGTSPDGEFFPADPGLLNTAHDGTHRGPFGGSLPYSLSGRGGIPAIIEFVVPPTGDPATPFTVQIKAVSGN